MLYITDSLRVFSLVQVCPTLNLAALYRHARCSIVISRDKAPGGGGGGALPDMGYIGMCRCEGYGFRAVYSRIGYINQSVWV